MNVLLLQMAHAEDVEDLGGLAGAPPEAAEVDPVPPPDAGEGSSAVPVPTVASEDPLSAAAPRAKMPRGWWLSRQLKTPRPRPGLCRWLNRR
jgi:hypothetical protein